MVVPRSCRRTKRVIWMADLAFHKYSGCFDFTDEYQFVGNGPDEDAERDQSGDKLVANRIPSIGVIAYLLDVMAAASGKAGTQ
ncbi:hypothetical protein ACMHYO_07680 [Allopusillimonas ginsengisoli]|uniref:hypothetical protein n=1 Tax=Allopusillimonas ginsengisoli TaxID=453575 RepID=UPI0039C0654F